MTLRDILRLVRPFWREGLLGLLRLLPWLVLLGFGIVWLYETDWLLSWTAFVAAMALAAWPLRRAIRRRAKSRAADLLGIQPLPRSEVTAREREAETVVHRLCVAAGPKDIASQAAVVALVQRTVTAVAGVFHPGHERAWARVTLVELLRLVEEIARGVREGARRTNLPADRVRLDTVLWMSDLAKANGERLMIWAKGAEFSWRVTRLLADLPRGLINEVERASNSGSDGALDTMARTALAQLLVQETGRVAIRLYAGRLSEDPVLEEARAAPIRLLLCGQPGSGRTALAIAISAALGSNTRGIGAPVEVLDGPALDGTATGLKRLQDEVSRADVVVWLAAATQPARGLDINALATLRTEPTVSPPCLLALSRCDQCSPVREWAPPYDLRTPMPGSKAATIRAALDVVTEQFGIPLERSVPIALPPGGKPYNVDALLAAVGEALPDARQRQLDRAMAARGLSLQRLLSKTVSSGTALMRSLGSAAGRSG